MRRTRVKASTVDAKGGYIVHLGCRGELVEFIVNATTQTLAAREGRPNKGFPADAKKTARLKAGVRSGGSGGVPRVQRR